MCLKNQLITVIVASLLIFSGCNGPDLEPVQERHIVSLAGTFTMSRYGGNRGEVGWDLLGFERRHHWQPPFGYYDAPYHAEGDKS